MPLTRLRKEFLTIAGYVLWGGVRLALVLLQGELEKQFPQNCQGHQLRKFTGSWAGLVKSQIQFLSQRLPVASCYQVARAEPSPAKPRPKKVTSSCGNHTEIPKCLRVFLWNVESLRSSDNFPSDQEMQLIACQALDGSL